MVEPPPPGRGWRSTGSMSPEAGSALPHLEDVVAGSELVFPVRRLAPDGLEAWRQVIARGYESYVAKDAASAYEGGPTRRWLKVKQKSWTVEEDRWRRRISATR
jgi:hypothetical protein